MIRRAIILAAGRGTRMGDGRPKPLVEVGGVPLIVRVLRILETLGVWEVAVVLGHRSQEVARGVRRALLSPRLRVSFFENPAYDLPNGVSLRMARTFVSERTLVLMADHVFEVGMLAPLVALEPGRSETVLAIDRDLRRVYDIDDATKVHSPNGRPRRLRRRRHGPVLRLARPLRGPLRS
jgi:choline kinase